MSRQHRPGRWTEAEFLALGETRERIELIDGDLVVSPSPNRPHQRIIQNLIINLTPPVRATGSLALFTGVDIRLASRRILCPDLVVGKLSCEPGVVDAGDLILACEVTSPSNASYDRQQKAGYYATAGIEWYLLVEPDMSDYQGVRLLLYRLESGRYVEHAVAEPGQVLVSDAPFPIALVTATLLQP